MTDRNSCETEDKQEEKHSVKDGPRGKANCEEINKGGLTERKKKEQRERTSQLKLKQGECEWN